jgi:hypothetical protein
MPVTRSSIVASIAAIALAASACASSADGESGGSSGALTLPTQADELVKDSASTAENAAPTVVPPGPGIVTVGLPAAYTPTSEGTATDDYRCFVLATNLPEDRFITGVRFVPGNAALVHHAILYRVSPGQEEAAAKRDADDPGEGWSCFGGPNLPAAADSNALSSLDSAPWLAAWAPGGREARYPEGTGVFVQAGSSVILQVHYNLLGGSGEDATSVELNTVGADADLRRLETMLLPAPVELPCQPDESGPLCDRDAAVADTIERFGGEAMRTIWGLQFMCGGDLTDPQAGATTSCTHRVRAPMTVYAAAGHMHLLGRSISIVANEGTKGEELLLDIESWDFDNQGGRPLTPSVDLAAGDTLTVTCTHDTGLRDLLPALADTEPRYITWGDGTTDEMCLGILTVSAIETGNDAE